MLKFFNDCASKIDGETYFRIYRTETKFENDIKPCGHPTDSCLPYYDSDKCAICDFEAIGNM